MDYTKIWDRRYGELLLKRTLGELPEMESSKEVARKLGKLVKDGYKILDVGCGTGHYLVSLKKRIVADFQYRGIDMIPDYIEMARKVFKGQKNVSFDIGSIYNLPYKNDAYDIVLCSNVLPVLPSIEKPIAELLRVARRIVLIRMLAGDRSFRIMEVANKSWHPNSIVDPSEEFYLSGEPKDFIFFNIYSKAYILSMISRYAKGAKCKITLDNSFNPRKIRNSAVKEGKLDNKTKMIGRFQVNGYILAPWAFVEIQKNSKSNDQHQRL